MKPLLALTFASSLTWVAQSAPQAQTTDSSGNNLELVFIEPGDSVWTRFGHIAIRVTNSSGERDVLFNFGFAPFDRPDFMWGYLRGESRFYLAVRPWDWSLARYQRWNRTVRRRPLNLPRPQLDELLRRLVVNARDENKEYLYDHLRDNCSTRVRDVLDEVMGGALRAAADARDPGRTYRHYTLVAGSRRLLVQIVFDLIGGPNQEQAVTGWAELYLPEFLEQALDEVALVDADGEPRPVLGEPRLAFERRGAPATTGAKYTGRYVVVATGGVVALLLLVAGWRRQAPLQRLAGLVLTPVALVWGLVGLALLALIVISRVADFAWNENVLVFVPFDLIWLSAALRWLVKGRGQPGRWVRGYTTVRLVELAAYAALKPLGVFPQDNYAFLAASALVVAGLFLTFRLPSA